MSVLAAATPRVVWYVSRGAGAAALLALTAAVVLGVLDVRRVSSARWPRFVLDALHRDLALAGLALLAVHVVTAMVDSYAPIGVLDTVLPFRSAYRPLWLGLGALAFDVLLAVALTSAARRRLGYGAWRAVHWSAYACWGLALVHGLGTGSDPRHAWMLALTLGCVLAVLVATAWRARGRALVLAGAGAFAVALGWWAVQGPLRAGWARRSGTPAAVVSGALPRRFTASVSGRLAELDSSDGRRAVVELPLSFGRGIADVRISGLLTQGGVTLEHSRVTFGPTADPQAYRGRVTRLEGMRLTAAVRRSATDRLRLRLELEADGNRLSGTLSVEPA